MSLSPASWYVVQSQANREARAAAELTRQGFEVCLPRYLRRVRHARRTTGVAAALFPGYLFVRLGSAQRWRSINGTIGVVRIVMAGERPAPLPAGIVEGLMQRRDAEGYIPLLTRPTLQAGELVRVTGGALAETLGLFEKVRDADRVAILLNLLGRKVRVLVDEALVEKAA